MRRAYLILLPFSFALCAEGGTPHPIPETCYAVQIGLDRAADFSWVNDSDKAAQLSEAYSTVWFYGDLLANALRSGASLESTKQIEAELLNAGKAFRDRAAALGVEIPTGPLSQYLDYMRLCSQPY